MKKILLTGGSGFIGRNILESFLNEKYEIIAPRHAELPLEDTKKVDAFFKKHSFDAVLHCATKPGHRNAKDHSDLLQTNLLMFYNLERNASVYGKLINFGSGAVYSLSEQNNKVSEEQLYTHLGHDSHSLSKYIISKHIQNMPNAVDLNIFGIFGKYEDYSIRFISNAICKGIYGKPITLKQNRKFSYLFIDDLMPILDYFILHDIPMHSYNIVPDNYLELLELATIIQQNSSSKVPIQVAEEGYGLDYYGDNMKLKAFMSEVDFTSLKESISLLYQYYSENRNKIDQEILVFDR